MRINIDQIRELGWLSMIRSFGLAKQSLRSHPMKHSVTELPRAVRRRLQRAMHKTRDKDYSRWALAILQLWETGGNVAKVATLLCAARSSVYRWRAHYETYGETGVVPQRRGRCNYKANASLLEALHA